MAETFTEDNTQRKLYLRFPQKVPTTEEVKQLSPSIMEVCYPRQKYARFCHIILESEAAVPEVLQLLNKKKYDNGHLIVEMPRRLQYVRNVPETSGRKKIDNEEKHKTPNLKKQDNNKVPGVVLNDQRHGKSEEKDRQIAVGRHVKKQNKSTSSGERDRRLWIKKLPMDTEVKDLIAAFPGCIWARVYKNKFATSCRALCKFTTTQQAMSVVTDNKNHQFKGKDVVIQLASSQQLRGSRTVKNKNFAGHMLRVKPDEDDKSVVELQETESNNEEELMDSKDTEQFSEKASDEDIDENSIHSDDE